VRSEDTTVVTNPHARIAREITGNLTILDLRRAAAGRMSFTFLPSPDGTSSRSLPGRVKLEIYR
jgi:hypothetical protein